jgi:hypothetical protein
MNGAWEEWLTRYAGLIAAPRRAAPSATTSIRRTWLLAVDDSDWQERGRPVLRL